MSFPSVKTVLWRVAADLDAPSNAHMSALTRLERPSRQLLVRIMREAKAPTKLKALAALLHADLMELRAKKKKAISAAGNGGSCT